MRAVTRALSIAALAACSGTADESEFVEPLRFDGSVEDDGIFFGEQHRESYCSENPDSRWCSDLGTTEQPWVSAEYHGLSGHASDSGTYASCWSSNSDNGDCLLPALKQMKIQFDVSRCKDAPSVGPKAPTAAVDQMIAGWKAGAREWNGVAPGVTVEDGTCAWPSGCVTVTMRCKEISGTPFASARVTTGALQTRVSNLPAVASEDQARARVYMWAEIDFDPHMLWFHLKNCVNPMDPAIPLNPTNAQVMAFATNTGMHEMGHMFGFGHVNNSAAIMYPSPSPLCAPNRAIWTSNVDALSVYNSSSSGGVTVSDQGLDFLGPR